MRMPGRHRNPVTFRVVPGSPFRPSFGFHPSLPAMKLLLTVILWSLLLLLCWPLALLVVIAWPLLWLLSIPFRVVGIVLTALLAFLRGLLFLPARVLGYREAKA